MDDIYRKAPETPHTVRPDRRCNGQQTADTAGNRTSAESNRDRKIFPGLCRSGISISRSGGRIHRRCNGYPDPRMCGFLMEWLSDSSPIPRGERRNSCFLSQTSCRTESRIRSKRGFRRAFRPELREQRRSGRGRLLQSGRRAHTEACGIHTVRDDKGND